MADEDYQTTYTLQLTFQTGLMKGQARLVWTLSVLYMTIEQISYDFEKLHGMDMPCHDHDDLGFRMNL